MCKSRERIVQERFDSFIKKVSRNFVVSYISKERKHCNFETGVENFDNVMAKAPLYRRPAGIFYFNGYCYEVYHYELAVALEELPGRDREVIMAKYWGAKPGKNKVTDKELAKFFRMSEKKMYRYQKKILHKLRDIMEEMNYHG